MAHGRGTWYPHFASQCSITSDLKSKFALFIIVSLIKTTQWEPKSGAQPLGILTWHPWGVALQPVTSSGSCPNAHGMCFCCVHWHVRDLMMIQICCISGICWISLEPLKKAENEIKKSKIYYPLKACTKNLLIKPKGKYLKINFTKGSRSVCIEATNIISH